MSGPAWLAAALAAVGYLWMLGRGQRNLVKVVPALLLAVAVSPVSSVLAFAFALCAVGDALLLRDDRFLAGLGAFLAAHVCFVVGFLDLAQRPPPAWATVAVAVAAAAVLRSLLPHVRGTLRAAVPLYALGLAAMAASASAVSPVGLLGGALFMLSDALLGWNRFVRRFAGADAAVMTTYYGALLLLARAAIA